MDHFTHLVINGKGGIGKSVIAALSAQYLHSKHRTPHCIDTDPCNRSFSAYAALNVHAVEILEGDDINPRLFDEVIEQISTAPGDVVVDSGASSFVALSSYLLSNDIPALLLDHARPLRLHVVIAGGSNLEETVHGFTQLARQFPKNTEFVVWLNPLHGPITHDGKEFEELKSYTTHKDRVTAIIRIPKLKPETFGADFTGMLNARQTFAEVLGAPETTVMSRHRLTSIRDRIFKQLETAVL